jgi:hypothetical protein
MASFKISKRLRKSPHSLPSDDEISQNGTNSSYVDSDDDCEYQPELKRHSTFSIVSNNSTNIQRKPTRVPDPKVKNRNALLARENRQRKKEQMEVMEKEIAELTRDKKQLQKMMKSYKENETKMAAEIRYLRAALNNQPGIVKLLKKFDIDENNTSVIKPSTQGSTDVSSGSETASVTSETATNDFCLDDVFDGMYNNPFEEKIIDDFQPSILTPPGSMRASDHDYTATTKTSKKSLSTPGICFHINDGRYSLEFCAQCHNNAINSWTKSI